MLDISKEKIREHGKRTRKVNRQHCDLMHSLLIDSVGIFPYVDEHFEILPFVFLCK